MIELRGLIASSGQAPLTAQVRVGEVIALDGAPAQVTAVLEVLAGRRDALAGEVVWRDPNARGVLVQDGDELPAGVDGEAALALWSALAGGVATRGAQRPVAARRGLGVSAVWLVDGGSDPAIDAAEHQVRGGTGAMVRRAGGARVDRTIRVEPAAGGAVVRGARAGVTPGGTGAWQVARRRAGALARFAVAAAGSRAALATAAVAAVWLALVATVVAAHEGFWFVDGTRAGLWWAARLGGLGAAVVAIVAAAARARAGAPWSAMLRETRVPTAVRRLALALGDAGGAVPVAMVAAWPLVWAEPQGAVALLRAVLAVAAVIASATVAAGLGRGARALAPLAALAGLGLALALMW